MCRGPGGQSDEELSANVSGKPCVGKPQARFDEESLESYPDRGGAPETYSIRSLKSRRTSPILGRFPLKKTNSRIQCFFLSIPPDVQCCGYRTIR